MKKTQYILLLVALASLLVYFYRVFNGAPGTHFEAETRGAEADGIACIDLIGADGKQVTIAAPNSNESESVLLFVFSKPCAPCNNNIYFWNKASKIKSDGFKTYGVIRSDLDDLINFSQNGKTDFDLYIPFDKRDFERRLKISGNIPVTAVIQNNQVVFIKKGTLFAEDYFDIKKHLKGETKP